jgi:hypothetical protein
MENLIFFIEFKATPDRQECLSYYAACATLASE